MHVLVVEDERKMADLLKRGLEEENHRVTVAQDGRIALELAKTYDFDVIVLRKSRTEAEYREALQEILTESEHTSHLIENLMLMVRGDAGTEMLRFETLDLAELVRSASARGRMSAEAKNIQWSSEISDERMWVEGDRLGFERLLLILIDNAVKYTQANGRIQLRVGRDDGDALIEVQDNGIGISDEELPHIFERFYRADKARSRELGGAGLGLSIGRWIARVHAGEITVKSAPKAGSTFCIRVPLSSLQTRSISYIQIQTVFRFCSYHFSRRLRAIPKGDSNETDSISCCSACLCCRHNDHLGGNSSQEISRSKGHKDRHGLLTKRR